MSDDLGPRVEREPVDATCPSCGGSAVHRYPVLSEGGWFQVVKCEGCLFSLARDRWHLLGPISLTSEGLSID
jgi:vanillate/4-hydroxybenzoate decarboxylase subunit D